jgi:hypothetical protein
VDETADARILQMPKAEFDMPVVGVPDQLIFEFAPYWLHPIRTSLCIGHEANGAKIAFIDIKVP